MSNLLVVGLMEPSMEGAVLSPTFSCLLAKVNAWEFNVVIARSSVADPDSGSGAFLTPGSGMGKKSGSGSWMNNPNHIFESLTKFFWVKILNFFDVDPGSGMKKFGSGSGIQNPRRKKVGSGIRDKHPGSATLALKNLIFSLSIL